MYYSVAGLVVIIGFTMGVLGGAEVQLWLQCGCTMVITGTEAGRVFIELENLGIDTTFIMVSSCQTSRHVQRCSSCKSKSPGKYLQMFLARVFFQLVFYVIKKKKKTPLVSWVF